MSATKCALVSACRLSGEVQGSAMVLLWLLVVIVIAGLTKVLWSRRRLRELAARIPGQPGLSLPLLGDALKFKGDGEVIFKLLSDSLSRHGSTFCGWIGPKLWVFISDPEDARIILTSKRYLNHDVDLMHVIRPIFGDGIITSRDEAWKNQRKILNPAFHINVLKQYIGIFEKHAKILVTRLKNFADGNTIDVLHIVGLSNLDISYETTLGVNRKFQFQTDCKLLDAIERFSRLIKDKIYMPWLMMDWVLNLTKWRKEQEAIQNIFKDEIGRLVVRKIQDYYGRHREDQLGVTKKKKPSFIDLLLEISESQGKVLAEKQVMDEVYNILVGAHETGAIINCLSLILLALHPDHQEKVVQELNAIFGEEEDRPVTMEDLQQMEYLERVIKETIRLFPAVPFTPREIDEEVQLNTCTLPAGCTAMVFSYGTHRDPRIFPEPDQFDPDRFLLDRVQARHPYSFLGFSAGPRMCIGYRYGMLSMKTVLSTVLRRYRVLPACSRQDLERLTFGIDLKPVCGFPLKMLPRQALSKMTRD